MTDEEREEEHFCEHCENSFEHDNGYCSNCSKWDYFIAGLEAGKPKWHDLRKDPNDLPEEDENYECIPWFDCKGVLVAWCELPKFKE